MILLPWAAALALPKNEAKCLFSLRAHSVLPLISLPPSLLYGRQFQDSCPWIVSPHLQILFIHGPFTYVHSSVNILFQLQSLPFPPGHLFKMVICFHLFHQMFLHQGDLTRDFFFQLFRRNAILIPNLCLFFSCWIKFEDHLSLSFSFSLSSL